MIDNFTDTELENEVWRDIYGYDGVYQVSDLGRVRSRNSGEWKVLRARKNRCGYLYLNLYKYGKSKTVMVHRLVAQAFIYNDDESKNEINHINEDKTDNKVSNLEYCDRQYNTTYNNIHTRRKPFIHTHPKLDKIKPLYRPDLSIDENLEIFKANGIECCIETVKRLRRYLGLTRKYTYRDKIKDLYNPDLTIKQNIEIFKSNGIQCSRDTIIRLRKDLGLSIHRNKTK